MDAPDDIDSLFVELGVESSNKGGVVYSNKKERLWLVAGVTEQTMKVVYHPRSCGKRRCHMTKAAA